MRLLILRPEPGATETAARALAMGLEPIVAPLFEIRKVEAAPVAAERYEAVLITSANGARHGPAGLAHLPCFAVGERSAAAAREAGFTEVRAGAGDGAAAAATMAEAGIRRAIHPCGRDHLPIEAPGVAIKRRVVYAADPVERERFEGPAVAMIHSPRSGRRFAQLAADRSSIVIAAISAAAAAAAGQGWAAKAVAAAPCDHALLELAASLCNTGGEGIKDGGDGL